MLHMMFWEIPFDVCFPVKYFTQVVSVEKAYAAPSFGNLTAMRLCFHATLLDLPLTPSYTEVFPKVYPRSPKF